MPTTKHDRPQSYPSGQPARNVEMWFDGELDIVDVRHIADALHRMGYVTMSFTHRTLAASKEKAND